MSKAREFTVLASQMVTPTTLVVTLHDSKKRLAFAYEPGQYAAITFFNHGRPTPARCFSMTSSPTEQDYMQFAMRVAGDFTTTAEHSLKEGSKVIVEGPYGSFAFNNERDTSALMLAGGIGVTPFISMMRYAARMQLPNDLMLVYSVHTQDDVPFLDELTEFTTVNPHLHVVYVVGSGPTDKLAGHSVMQGHVDGPLLDRITSKVYDGRTYFVCGPPGFMNAVSKALIKNGAPEDNVLTEAFSQGEQSPKSIKHNVPLQVYALTGLSIVLGAGTLLAKDVAATAPALSASRPSQSGSSQSNSRQDSVNQTINSLQNADSGSTAPSTDTTQSPSGSSSTQVTVNTSPTGSSSGKSSSSTGSKTPSPTSGGGGSSSSGSGGGSTSGSGGGSSSGSGSGSGGSSGGGSGGTPTPPPPPPPPPVVKVAPTVTLTSSSTSITSGQSVTLSWHLNSNVTTPVTCTASGGWSGTKGSSGSVTVRPTSTTTYTLTCSNAAGSNGKYVTINVAPACVSTPSNPC